MKYRRKIRDSKIRHLFKKTELCQLVLKVLSLFKVDLSSKYLIRKKVVCTFVIDIFKTRIRNYCIITGRARGVFSFVKVSRIIFREVGSKGLFFGLKKASW